MTIVAPTNGAPSACRTRPRTPVSGRRNRNASTATASTKTIALTRPRSRYAGLVDRERDTVVSAFAEAVGLDGETLQPPAGQPWLPTLLAAARSGVLRDWSAAERAQLEQMRRLRGVW